MRITIDTNILIRYFTDDEPKKADLVEELLEKEKSLSIPDVVFPELEYILGKQYAFSRKRLVGVYASLLSFPNIKISQEIRKAVTLYKNSRLDMADCIIAAYSLKGALASFDKELLQVDTVKSFWK